MSVRSTLPALNAGLRCGERWRSRSPAWKSATNLWSISKTYVASRESCWPFAESADHEFQIFSAQSTLRAKVRQNYSLISFLTQNLKSENKANNLFNSLPRKRVTPHCTRPQGWRKGRTETWSERRRRCFGVGTWTCRIGRRSGWPRPESRSARWVWPATEAQTLNGKEFARSS